MFDGLDFSYIFGVVRAITFILLLFSAHAWAYDLDSLSEKLTSASAEDKLQILKTALSDASRSDSVSFFKAAAFCQSASIELNLRQAVLGYVVIYEAQWDIANGEDEKALSILQEHERFFENRSREERALVAVLQAEAFINLGSTSESLRQAMLALDEAKSGNIDYLTIRALKAVGDCYRRTRNYEQALKYFEKAIEVGISDSAHLPELLGSAATVLSKLGRFEDAKANVEQAIDIAIKKDQKYAHAKLLTALGFLYNEHGEYKKALEYYEESLALKQQIGDLKSIAYTLNDIGEMHSFLQNGALGVKYSKRALELAKETNALYYVRDINRTLSNTYKSLGVYDSALYYFESYSVIQDEILNTDNATEVARIEKLREIKEKDLQNALLESENKVKSVDIKRKNWVIGVSGLLFLVLLVLTQYVIRLNARRKKLLIEVNAQNEQLNSQNQIFSRLLNEQESLFYIVTHDLQGPIANIVQLLKLEREETDIEMRKELRTMISISADRALQFIRDFAELNSFEKKSELPPINEFDLHELANSVLHDFNSTIKRKALRVHFGNSNPVKVSNRESYVRHILYNLISNAIKFSPQNGTLFINIIDKDSVRISVEDQGPGIPEHLYDRIFERFFRGDSSERMEGYKSSGLGLALVKLLVEKIGGRIKVKSTEGLGSEFTLYLD